MTGNPGTRGKSAAMAAIFCALCLSALASLCAGSSDIGPADAAAALFGFGSERDAFIVREIRLPRVSAALFGGAGLAVAGCALQCVLRNPLASASTLGISQGAGFGAAFAIIALGAGSFRAPGPAESGGPACVAVCAFAGALASAAAILGLSRFWKSSPEGTILCGTAMGAMFAGATALLQYFADEVDVASVVFWTFGDLGRVSAGGSAAIAAAAAAITAVCASKRWSMNAREYGDETAASLGVRTGAFRAAMVAMCALVAAAIVSFAGVINFVGLIAPHMARKFVGGNYAPLVPASAMTGAALMLLSDVAARTVAAPASLPIGAITSLLGAPAFLYLLSAGGRRP